MAAACPSSLSSSSNCLNGRSSIPRLRRPHLNLHFCNDSPGPRLFSVRSQAPNVDGLGSKRPARLDYQETSSSSSAIDFLTLCHSLKACQWIILTTKRKGWINHGIKGPESIADHMYRMALMALIAGDLSGVNRERCIKIAIVHDIAEAIVGDITPSDGVPKAEKSRREQAALDEMCKVLGGGMRAEEIQELWAEYENNSSIEANLVKDFDKGIHVVITAETNAVSYFVYQSGPLGISSALWGKFQTEIGKNWAAEINSRRKSLLDNRPN
ncbi:hypothetical protein RJ639_045853 [Escallonia herrerae]|uniref:HD domain-containing protein n=1 Tax=Escallonia herrerae TaxID=1293975 RepID=A0AA88W437_9ASTE|nr:hypothetical protein RJ639_045853 [Escallonia herrerae]